MDKQRSEDITPANREIEEKIKRMLDPSLPDEPAPINPVQPLEKPNKPAKIIAVSSPVELATNEVSAAPTPLVSTTPSAPELPSEKKSIFADKSKKIIIPISHNDEEISDKPASSKINQSLTDKPDAKSESKKTTPPKKELEVKSITTTDNSNSAEELSEKLNKTIAELDQQKPDTEEVEPASDQIDFDEADKSNSDKETTDQNDKKLLEDKIAEPEIISSPSTDKAVEEIVAAEGDELLEIEDAVRETDEPVKPVKKTRKKLFPSWKKLWAKPNFRWALLGVLILLIIAIGFIPSSRYLLLNSAGIRAKSSIVVLDQSTQLPLKNVSVSIGGTISATDKDGKVNMQKLKLGSTTLKLEKRAFASVDKKITIGLGSNPLGDFSLTPTGNQYKFMVTDYLSGKPIEKVEATSGDASAFSDNKGEIKLTIDNKNDENFKVSLNSESYRRENIDIIPSDNSVRNIKLVPSKKHVFVSNRSGKFDIFSNYIDGKEEKLVLGASGKEKEGMVLVPHPSEPVVAYVSTRAGKTNKDGFTLSNLLLINTDDNSTTDIALSERIQVVNWIGDRLVYVLISEGTSANSPKRYRLMSYNIEDSSSTELASGNYFNDIIVVDGKIYFAPASAYQTSPPGLFRINADGSEKQTVFDQEVWNIFRTSYEDLALSVQQNWYNYHIGDKAPTKQNAAPSNQTSRVYIANPSDKKNLWVDIRDGKGALVIYDKESKKDTVVNSQSGLSYPAMWLNDSTIVYRVKTGQETADYAFSIDGGTAVKINDVTNYVGIDRWNY